MMLSERLKVIADLIPPNAKVIDIGTDHAYLPIYLYQKNITHNIVATDISQNVLNSSLNNLQKYNLDKNIDLILSDGFSNIKERFDVGIISGMGASTIIKILNTKELPNMFIIQSNNDHYKLRKYLMNINYKLIKEIIVKEKKHYYIIMKYEKGSDNLTEAELLFGISNNLDYYHYLLNHYKFVYNKSHAKKYLNYISILNNIIEKIQVKN